MPTNPATVMFDPGAMSTLDCKVMLIRLEASTRGLLWPIAATMKAGSMTSSALDDDDPWNLSDKSASSFLRLEEIGIGTSVTTTSVLGNRESCCPASTDPETWSDGKVNRPLGLTMSK